MGCETNFHKGPRVVTIQLKITGRKKKFIVGGRVIGRLGMKGRFGKEKKIKINSELKIILRGAVIDQISNYLNTKSFKKK